MTSRLDTRLRSIEALYRPKDGKCYYDWRDPTETIESANARLLSAGTLKRGDKFISVAWPGEVRPQSRWSDVPSLSEAEMDRLIALIEEAAAQVPETAPRGRATVAHYSDDALMHMALGRIAG